MMNFQSRRNGKKKQTIEVRSSEILFESAKILLFSSTTKYDLCKMYVSISYHSKKKNKN